MLIQDALLRLLHFHCQLAPAPLVDQRLQLLAGAQQSEKLAAAMPEVQVLQQQIQGLQCLLVHSLLPLMLLVLLLQLCWTKSC